MAFWDSLLNLRRGLELVRILNFDPQRRRGPLCVEVAVTSRCNHRCYFCAAHSSLLKASPPGQTLSDEVIRQVFEDAVELGVQEMLFSGDGEPLLNKGLPELILRFSRRLRIKLLSNGSTLPRLTPEVFAGLFKLTVSLNSIDPETHKKIHGYPGPSQLPKILDDITRLCALPGGADKIQINYVFTKDNLGELEALIEQLRRWDVRFAARPLTPNVAEAASLKPSDGELKNLLARIATLLEDGGLPPKLRDSLRSTASALHAALDRRVAPDVVRPCYVGFYWGNIWSDGAYTPCCYCRRVLGDVSSTRLKDIWRDPHTQKVVYGATLMHQTGELVCKECRACPGSQLQSAPFHRMFSRLPLQKWLLRKRWRRYAAESDPQ